METFKAPCKGCKDRKIIDNKSCHSWCGKYKEWCINNKKFAEEQNQRKRIDKDSYSISDSINIRKGYRK